MSPDMRKCTYIKQTDGDTLYVEKLLYTCTFVSTHSKISALHISNSSFSISTTEFPSKGGHCDTGIGPIKSSKFSSATGLFYGQEQI